MVFFLILSLLNPAFSEEPDDRPAGKNSESARATSKDRKIVTLFRRNAESGVAVKIGENIGKETAIVLEDNKAKTKLRLNDENDSSDLEKIIIPTVMELEEKIQKAIGPALGMSKLDRYTYAMTQGLAGGRMDLAGAVIAPHRGLILFQGTLYNNMDFGNLLWGAAMARLGFEYWEVKAGSECNGFMNSNPQNSNGNGFCFTGDAKEDQEAIRVGFNSSIGKRSVRRYNEMTRTGSCPQWAQQMGTQAVGIHGFITSFTHVFIGNGLAYETDEDMQLRKEGKMNIKYRSHEEVKTRESTDSSLH